LGWKLVERPARFGGALQRGQEDEDKAIGGPLQAAGLPLLLLPPSCRPSISLQLIKASFNPEIEPAAN